MKKNKKIFIIILALIMVFSFSTNVMASDLNESKEITTVYEYPINPSSEEWAEFDTRMEKVKACTIPEEILSNMSTEALVKTVLDYPLLIDMFAYNTKQQGYDAVLRVFNGLQELSIRKDSLTELSKYESSLKLIRNKDSEVTVKLICFEYLYIGIDPNISENSLRYSYRTVYTPQGSAVTTKYNYTWADHGVTASQANATDNAFAAAYPNATRLRQEYPSYNCHSYAWYSTSSTNKHWISYPNAYMTDGSYWSGTAQVGSKVYYGSTADHSGRVVYVGGGSGANVGVKSKWGALGLYSHNISDCPYADGSYTCTFWN